jgi:probable DNA metabolism protein
MNRSLAKLLSMLEDGNPSGAASECDLFGFAYAPDMFQYEQADIDLLALYFSGGFDSSYLSGPARRLFELSFNAFDLLLHAWLSELPVEKETVRFGRRVLAAAEGAAAAEQKSLAEYAAADRGDSDTLAVLSAAYKVQYEIDKMRGLLRFIPQNDVYAARCAPDHFVLPALARHFSARFGETSWAITDEKRGLCLSRVPPAPAMLVRDTEGAQGAGGAQDSGGGEWEELWRHYHSTVNNEQRNNPGLQRRFMPKRYWKYLPEM